MQVDDGSHKDELYFIIIFFYYCVSLAFALHWGISLTIYFREGECCPLATLVSLTSFTPPQLSLFFYHISPEYKADGAILRTALA